MKYFNKLINFLLTQVQIFFVKFKGGNYPTQLYIIGNGFDMYHGIKSSYSHFRDYVKSTDDKLFEAVEENFPGIDLWSDFENSLIYLDTDSIEDDAKNYLVSYSSNEWSDAYHHDYQYEIQRRIDVITKELRKKFNEWVFLLEGNWHTYDSKFSFPQDAYFLTFNYTTTLESLYNISETRVLHIHNKIVNKDSLLILGHGRKPKPEDSFNFGEDLEDQDVRISEGNRILDAYFLDTYKSTEKIINENKNYFVNLKRVKQVIILGHSLSSVDIPYFEEIIKSINLKKVKWVVSYYSDIEKFHHLQALVEIGVDEKMIKLSKIESL